MRVIALFFGCKIKKEKRQDVHILIYQRFSNLSLDEQEAIAYFVGNNVPMGQLLKDKSFLGSWKGRHNHARIARTLSYSSFFRMTG